ASHPAQARGREGDGREALDGSGPALAHGRGDGFGAAHDLDLHEQAVPAAGQRLYVARRGRLVAERGADLSDAEVQRLFEVDERAFRPHLALDLFASHQLSRPADEKAEDARGLGLEARPYSRLPQLAAPRVQLEDPE